MDENYLQYLNFSYTQEHLNQLEAIEQKLNFSHFNSKDALNLGLTVLEISRQYQEDIIIQITREEDQVVICQYVMDSKSQKNITYASLKRNTVLKTGHSSFWKLVHDVVENQSIETIFGDQSYLPVGGAFPLYTGEKHVATLAISGLHEGLDHELIVKALCRYLNKDVCNFSGKLF